MRRSTLSRLTRTSWEYNCAFISSGVCLESVSRLHGRATAFFNLSSLPLFLVRSAAENAVYSRDSDLWITGYGRPSGFPWVWMPAVSTGLPHLCSRATELRRCRCFCCTLCPSPLASPSSLKHSFSLPSSFPSGLRTDSVVRKLPSIMV